MLPIALSELIQLLRNRSVLISGLLIPLAACASFVFKHELFAEMGGLGYVASTVVFTVAAFSLYATVVTTLASRRQNLFLKRLRSTTASDTDILLGLVLPTAGLAVVQTAGILIVLAAIAGGPDNVALLAAAVVATALMMLALGLATAGLTNSPEHAQITTLPISLGAVAVSMWVGLSGTEDFTAVKRALPGGAAAELVNDAWNGGAPLQDSLLLLLATLAWVAIAAALAAKFFRWEPRR